jgi:cytochrome c oxidase subunit 2
MFWDTLCNIIFFNLEMLLTYLDGNIVVCFLDVAEPWQLGFQDPATPTMEGIIDFHNHLMFFIVLIAIFTTWILIRCFHFYADDAYGDSSNRREVAMFTHSTPLEIIWTLVPAVVLLFIAVPSFALLYSMDEMIDPALTFKVVGHQWYWSAPFNIIQR